MKKIEKDENSTRIHNSIFKYCCYILFFGIIVDLTIKCIVTDFTSVNLIVGKRRGYSFDQAAFLSTLIMIDFEILLLIGSFLTRVFMLAKKGVLIWALNKQLTIFPSKHYALVSLIVSASAAGYFLFINICRSVDSVGLMVVALIAVAIIVGLFLATFLLFFVAYKVAKKNEPSQSNLVEKTATIEV